MSVHASIPFVATFVANVLWQAFLLFAHPIPISIRHYQVKLTCQSMVGLRNERSCLHSIRCYVCRQRPVAGFPAFRTSNSDLNTALSGQIDLSINGWAAK